MARLQDEIKQQKPFASAEEETHLALQRTAAVLGKRFAEAVKAQGLTPTQYNVLRILRGAGEQGLCRYEIGDRLVAQVPDVTRLLDRLEAMGLLTRQRHPEDRRQLQTVISPKGLELLAALDAPVLDSHRDLLGHMTAEEHRQLTELLGRARERA